LDFDCVNKNGFCILVGAYLRKHAVSPKNINVKEYEILLNAYKALFQILDRDYAGAQDSLNAACQSKNTFGQDSVSFQQNLNRSATQQHASLLSNIQAYLLTLTGNAYRGAQTLFNGTPPE